MIKMFKVKSELDERPTIISIYKNEHTNEIIQTYDIRAPHPEELQKTLEISGLWEIGVELNKRRKNPYKVSVEIGTSGCQDYYIQYAVPVFPANIDAYRIRRTHVLHVSMYDKINESTRCWLGDLIAVLQALNLDTTNITAKELTAYRLDELIEKGFTLPNIIEQE
jgi:hypothetical protein